MAASSPERNPLADAFKRLIEFTGEASVTTADRSMLQEIQESLLRLLHRQFLTVPECVRGHQDYRLVGVADDIDGDVDLVGINHRNPTSLMRPS